MSEEEKIDMREHLINWIDTFLKDGIIPKIVNPKAIETNYIPKQVIIDKIKELEEERKEIESSPYDKWDLYKVIGKIEVLKSIIGE